MKTKIKTTVISYAITIFFTLISIQSNAQSIQCAYQIDNNTTCTLKVDVTFYDAGGICHTITGIGISPNTSVGVNCSTCGTLTDLKVEVVGASGTSITGFFVDVNNQTDNSSGCTATGMNMDWFTTYSVIYP